MQERRVVMLSVVMLAAGATVLSAQEKDPKTPDRPAGGATVADPETRFRFIERYAVDPDRAKPEALLQYQVAIHETVKTMVEKPQGAPDRMEIALRIIYTERAARVGSGAGGDVLAAVRRYDVFRGVPDRSAPGAPRILEGLTLWYHPRISDEPQLLSLTDRSLTQEDYLSASQQAFLPDLRGLLPTAPLRVADTWPIPVSAARALVCDPNARGHALTAKLVDVRRDAGQEAKPQWVAVISITGPIRLARVGDSAVSAELEFKFAPPAPAPATAKTAQTDEATIEARGAISQIRMAIAAAAPAEPDRRSRLRQITTKEIVLERRLAPDSEGLLRIPNPPPEPTEANSWLTKSVPPMPPSVPGFSFRHPQELLPPPGSRDPDLIELIDSRPERLDKLTLELLPKTGKATEDRMLRDPETHRQKMLEKWQTDRLEVVQGPHGWLPAADWDSHNMKVYRLQAALKETAREFRALPRTYIDFYLVLFGRDECLVLTATTPQDPPINFRKQAEAVLKTFRFDGSRPAR